MTAAPKDTPDKLNVVDSEPMAERSLTERSSALPNIAAEPTSSRTSKTRGKRVPRDPGASKLKRRSSTRIHDNTDTGQSQQYEAFRLADAKTTRESIASFDKDSDHSGTPTIAILPSAEIGKPWSNTELAGPSEIANQPAMPAEYSSSETAPAGASEQIASGYSSFDGSINEQTIAEEAVPLDRIDDGPRPEVARVGETEPQATHPEVQSYGELQGQFRDDQLGAIQVVPVRDDAHFPEEDTVDRTASHNGRLAQDHHAAADSADAGIARPEIRRLRIGSSALQQFALTATVPILVGALAAYLVAILSPNIYGARTEIVFDVSSYDWNGAERFLATQLVIVKARSILNPISNATKIPLKELEEDLVVEMLGSSDVMRIEYRDEDQARATEIVGAITDRYLIALRDYEPSQGGQHRILLPATPLEDPVYPKPSRAAAIGAAIGLMVAAAGIFVRMQFWPTK
jgi:capsular polysaccharide biosynthesis protein